MLDRHIWAWCQTRSFASLTLLGNLRENMWQCTVDTSLSLTFSRVGHSLHQDPSFLQFMFLSAQNVSSRRRYLPLLNFWYTSERQRQQNFIAPVCSKELQFSTTRECATAEVTDVMPVPLVHEVTMRFTLYVL